MLVTELFSPVQPNAAMGAAFRVFVLFEVF